MRRAIGCLLLASCVMSACTPTPSQTRKPVTAKATTKPKGTVTPAPRATATPLRPAASTKPTLLEGPTTLMTGQVEIDAHYIVANNAGSIIANGGGSVIALKGGSLISDNGLGLISDNGLGLISDNGLGLIANNSAGLIANNAGSFRIQQAANVALGTMLPVKGMAIIPISMRTGEIVGKPVLTDESGTYKLQVPQAVSGSIRLVGRVPVEKKEDPFANDVRAQYNLVLETTATDAVIDEDTSISSRYVRACFANRFKEIMLSEDADKTSIALVQALGFDPSIRQYLITAVVELNETATAAGVASKTPAQIDALCQRVTDLLLSYVKIDAIVSDPAKFGRVGTKEPALAGMTDVLTRIRVVATQEMLVDPDHYNQMEMVKKAHWVRTIKKPADMCDFVVDNHLLSISSSLIDLKAALQTLGVGADQGTRLNEISIAVLAEIGQTLLTVPSAKAEILATIKASGTK